MRDVGHTDQITLYAPRDAYFSYFNSPYIGHEQGSSIDIYPSYQEWGGSVSSPISGSIIRIQKIKMGRARNFPTEPYDFGIGIKPEGSADKIVRILHCVPDLDINERVDIGDHIGTTLRSRYFNYWTGPHYHVDVMNLQNFNRASKSFPIKLNGVVSCSGSKNSLESFECIITRVTEDIVTAVSRDYPSCNIGDLAGLVGITSDSKTSGVLDGGIPHYKHGGLWAGSQPMIGETVSLWNYPIGRISNTTTEYCIFKRGPQLKFKIDGMPVKGLSCFIFSPSQLIHKLVPLMIIPIQRGQFVKKLNEGDACVLSLH